MPIYTYSRGHYRWLVSTSSNYLLKYDGVVTWDMVAEYFTHI